MNIEHKILIGCIGFGIMLIFHFYLRFRSDRQILNNCISSMQKTNSNKKIKQIKEVSKLI